VKTPRIAAGVVGVLLAATVLVGCNNPINAGAAATVGAVQIPASTVATQVNDALDAQGKAPNTPDAALTQNTINRLVLTELMNQLATENNVEITQGEIDTTLASAIEQSGGEEALKLSLTQQGIPYSALKDVIRLNLIIQKLQTKYPADGATDPNQLLFQDVVKRSEELGIQVNPQFGTWDAAKLKLGPVPNNLSVPLTS